LQLADDPLQLDPPFVEQIPEQHGLVLRVFSASYGQENRMIPEWSVVDILPTEPMVFADREAVLFLQRSLYFR
jgi:hypothetical protein